MVDETRTTTLLLEGLHDPANATAWGEFDQRYRPIVLRFAVRLGLSEADAADAAQETMTRFLAEYRRGAYDRSRGRLRSWLIGLAKGRIADLRRRSVRRREQRGESAIIDMQDEAQLTQIWDTEQRSVIMRLALDRLRQSTRTSARTIRAFEMLVLNQLPMQAVTDELGMSAQDVYLAKSRVAQRLRTIVSELEAVYDESTP